MKIEVLNNAVGVCISRDRAKGKSAEEGMGVRRMFLDLLNVS